jgi:pseudouridine kinase
MLPLVQLLEEKGDEIFSSVNGVVLEVDLDKDLVKKVLELCRAHGVRIVGLVSNMNIAAKRRDFLQQFDCFICNQLEAGTLFLDDYSALSPEELCQVIAQRVPQARIPAMVVTMGEQGAVYADCQGNRGICPARKVLVKDTTGAGDAFCAGVAIGLTYGKDFPHAIEIGSTLAASVITSSENVCPRFQPAELGLDVQLP